MGVVVVVVVVVVAGAVFGVENVEGWSEYTLK